METFQQIQLQFAQHIRDPERYPAPTGTDERRMQVYRTLFFNNVEGFVSSAFPVLKSLFAAAEWEQIVREFFAQHPCATPIFVEIAQEFLLYLCERYPQGLADKPFMLELAHYEWVELAVSVQRIEPEPACLADWNNDTPLSLYAAARVVSYLYPVHQISRDHQPQQPAAEPTFLLVYRDLNFATRFVAISPMLAQVLNQLQQTPASIAVIANDVAVYLPQLTANQLELLLAETFTPWIERGLLRAG